MNGAGRRSALAVVLPAMLAPALASAQTPVAWIAGPSLAQVAAHYPDGAKAAGHAGRAELSCTVAAQGRLRDCAAIGESPRGEGFGNAARQVARDLRAGLSGAIHDGSEVRVMVAFDPAMLRPGFVAPDPTWTALPSAADFQATFPKTQNGVNDVRVTLLCDAQADGSLSGCTVADEAPAGEGYGAGALALGPRFKVAPWTPQGYPTAGAKVRVPIHYKLTPVPPPPKS